MNRLCVWAKGAKNREEVAYGRDIGKVEVARPLFPPPPPRADFFLFLHPEACSQATTDVHSSFI